MYQLKMISISEHLFIKISITVTEVASCYVTTSFSLVTPVELTSHPARSAWSIWRTPGWLTNKERGQKRSCAVFGLYFLIDWHTDLWCFGWAARHSQKSATRDEWLGINFTLLEKVIRQKCRKPLSEKNYNLQWIIAITATLSPLDRNLSNNNTVPQDWIWLNWRSNSFR